jgi:hypothetical protein
MTLFDYANAHPWWTLVYLLVICFTAVVCAEAVIGRRR